MKTKYKITRILSGVAFCVLNSSLLTSCSDFLDILPMNEVVLENFWTEKGDVISVVNSCYETLESSDCLTRMGVCLGRITF